MLPGSNGTMLYFSITPRCVSLQASSQLFYIFIRSLRQFATLPCQLLNATKNKRQKSNYSTKSVQSPAFSTPHLSPSPLKVVEVSHSCAGINGGCTVHYHRCDLAVWQLDSPSLQSSIQGHQFDCSASQLSILVFLYILLLPFHFSVRQIFHQSKFDSSRLYVFFLNK